MGTTPKMLAKTLGMPLRTVKWHLQTLVRDEVVENPFRGQYVYRSGTPDVTADPDGKEGVHGLVLAMMNLPEDLLRRSNCPKLASDPLEEGTRFRESTQVWNAHLVRFRYYPSTGTLAIYVPASQNPVGWKDMGYLKGWLEGFLGLPPGAPPMYVVQIGVHVDHEQWTFKGIQAVEFSRWRNAIEQLYQKKNALRHEVHSHYRKGELTLDRAVKILAEGSPTRQLERLLQIQLKVLAEESRLRDLGQGPIARTSDKPLPPGELWGSGYG